MRHMRSISRMPAQASTGGVCTSIDNEYQALLCFMLQLLTEFFLPLSQAKTPAEESSR